MTAVRPRVVRVHALAKINLTLRVLGRHADGYHELRTTFQSLALHDSLICRAIDGPFRITCDDPSCPVDRTNLVWKAAEGLWRAAGRRGRPRGVAVDLVKRIPSQAGLGGGSSDAAAALRALSALWGLRLGHYELGRLAGAIGADVAFFLEGGTALGVERGDVIFPLPDHPPAFVVVALPPFGVSTREAYGWLDEEGPVRPGRRSRIGRRPGSLVPSSEWRNDLQGPVARRHPVVGRLIGRLAAAGATYAAMSGSGSAVFGLFEGARGARAAAAVVAARGVRTLVTRTLTARRARHAARLRID